MVKKKKIGKILIGNWKVNVYETNRIENGFLDLVSNLIKGRLTIGQTTSINRKVKYIQLLEGLGKKDRRETVFHEIGHSLCFYLQKKYPLFKDLNYNEDFVEFFGKNMHRTFKSLNEHDNKRILYPDKRQ